MGNTDVLGDPAGVVDVLAGAARALAARRSAVVVELERDADRVIAGGLDETRRDRAVDAPRHRNDHARAVGDAVEASETSHVDGGRGCRGRHSVKPGEWRA